MSAPVRLYVDGSCGAGEDVGAWAAVCVSSVEVKILYGSARPTTISRMELSPIIEGLMWIRKHWGRYIQKLEVDVYSDSEYTVKTLSGLYEAGNKNADLWAAWGAVTRHMVTTYTWVPRNTLPYMTLCDGICSALRTGVKDVGMKMFDGKEAEETIGRLDEGELNDN